MTESTVQRDISTLTPVFVSEYWFKAFAEHVNHDRQNISLPLTESAGLTFFSRKNTNQPENVLESMTNYYSPIFGIAGQPVTTVPSAEILQQHANVFSSFDYINILPLYSRQADAWIKAFATLGFKGFTYQHSMNWYEPNIASTAEYWQRRPSKLKNTLKRKQELMNKDGNFKIKIYSQGSPALLIQALIDYHHVYYHSWKRLEPSPAFIDCICQYSWHINALRIGIIYYRNKPIAAQIWFIHNKTAAIFKLAYHKEYTRFSPGTILTAALLEHVISVDNVSTLDFLTGNDDYKKDWMSVKQPLYGIQLCNINSWRGKMRAFVNYVSNLKPKSSSK
tara:strand:+ start:8447 stop:9454 length:1008 start_codon:yes stop_codon:yes gene_type:complete